MVAVDRAESDIVVGLQREQVKKLSELKNRLRMLLYLRCRRVESEITTVQMRCSSSCFGHR